MRQVIQKVKCDKMRVSFVKDFITRKKNPSGEEKRLIITHIGNDSITYCSDSIT